MGYKINNIAIRTPTSFSWDIKDIESSENGINVNNGRCVVDIISQKRVLSCKWIDPSPEEVSTILQLIHQRNIFSFTYPDALSNKYETREFKAQKKSAPFRDYRVGAKLYSELSLELEEI